MQKTSPLLLALALFAFAQAPFAAPVKNGFDLATAEIPPDDILRGGPPRDGIPAVHDPKFVPADAATFLAPDDRVLGLVVDETARAYPVRILDWHEIVNDRIGDIAFAVTYCPLCGSGVVFRANVGGEQLSFGVSGLLYKSDVLLYDLQTETLWSQLLRRAVSGELRGTRLQSLPVVHTTWNDWKTRHPDSQVLSTDTGHARDYSRSPYGNYDESRAIYFPVGPDAPRFHPKEPVLGVEVGGNFKAYPFSELEKNGKRELIDVVGNATVTILWNPEAYAAELNTADNGVGKSDAKGVGGTDGNEPAEAARVFWFAWFAFHPETEIFLAQ